MVLEAICAQAERYPAFEPVELDTKALDDRDAALAHALAVITPAGSQTE